MGGWPARGGAPGVGEEDMSWVEFDVDEGLFVVGVVFGDDEGGGVEDFGCEACGWERRIDHCWNGDERLFTGISDA